MRDYTTPIFHRLRALTSSSNRPQIKQEYRARELQRIPSELGRSGTLIPFNHTKTTLVRFKTHNGDNARGHFGLK